MNTENNTSPAFIPPLLTYERSIPVDPQWLKPDPRISHYVDRYWLKTEPRVVARPEVECNPVSEMEADWKKRSGISTHTTISPSGGLMGLTLPESDLNRLGMPSALNAFAFIEDDLYDGDFASRVPEFAKEKLRKDIRIIHLQMRGKLYYEMLTSDEEIIRFVEKYEHWARLEYGEEKTPIDFKDMDEYLEVRMLNGGIDSYIALTIYLHHLDITDDQLQRAHRCSKLAYGNGILLNDFFSCEKEWITHATADKQSVPTFSGVWITLRTHDCTLKEAREIAKQRILSDEQEFLHERERVLKDAKPGRDYEILEKYIGYLQLMYSGYFVHAMHCPRYIVEKESSPYFPLPEHTIDTLPRIPGSLKKGTRSISQNGLEHHANGSIANKNTTNGYNFSHIKPEEPKPWLLDYPTLSDETTMEPCNYINSLPSKRIRRFAIDALDIWYKVPAASVTTITNIIEILHSSSLIIDDIEDNSSLRRGRPSTHMIFGTPQSINSANYLFVKSLEEVQKLGLAAVVIYTDELRNLHVGQGLDLHWTFHAKHPTEKEYIQMIDGKTGGLFRMAARLMRLEASQNHDLDVEKLVTLMGRFFQIRDDYQNLGSKEYARAKGSLSDLDEGKYSFMLIHALRTTKDSQLLSLLKLRSQQPGGLFTPEQKSFIMKCFGRTKSMEYTLEVLKELQKEIGKMLVKLESGPVLRGQEENWMVRAVMARLKLGYDVGGYTIYQD
ncbi:hypothetical protein TWF506_003898 [Arthrobotrys conoides]|uniref:Uncharacterized protein n=1 Tax=Arthrobotrys conoides TaxID=74498 RepID=A0AAN8NAL8_9PEZI